MVIVDTSAWIEWLIGSALGRRIADELPERHDWLVPTIVQLELAKWLTREAGGDKANSVIAFTQTCVIIDLTSPIALSAAELCSRHRLATADAVVYATALAQTAEVIAGDRHLANLAGVKYFVKRN